MRNIIKLGVFLLVVAGLAGLGIAYVNGLTEPIIAGQLLENKLSSLKEVYADADEIKDETDTYLKGADPVITEINVAYKNGAPAGVIYTVATAGYGGPVQSLVGFDIESQQTTAVKVISQTETPGLGAKAVENSFSDGFKNKDAALPVEIVKKEPVQGNQVLAITAATITSNAVADGVNAARENFMSNFVK